VRAENHYRGGVPTDPPALRASDADREATAERLRVAAAEGRLDHEELEERLNLTYSAKLCSELGDLTADVTPAAPAAPAAPPAPTFVRPPTRTNGFAVASLVISLVWIVGSVLAIVFGHVALKQISASDGEQTGRGFAVAGLAIGYFGALTFMLALVASLF
jgi:Domain of unknown function (DUF1707)/Domain of unknown function (DUF4190)